MICDWSVEESEYRQLKKSKETAQPRTSWVHLMSLVSPIQTQMTSPPVALQSRTPPATPRTPGGRPGSAALATGSGWPGTTWGPSSPSSSSALWSWHSFTWCRPSSTEGPLKTRSSLSSSTSAGRGPLRPGRTLQRQLRCSVQSPPRPLSKSSSNCTQTMRRYELAVYKKGENFSFLCGYEEHGLNRDYTRAQCYFKGHKRWLYLWVSQERIWTWNEPGMTGR